jgi:hypothetical protein
MLRNSSLVLFTTTPPGAKIGVRVHVHAPRRAEESERDDGAHGLPLRTEEREKGPLCYGWFWSHLAR